MSALQPVPGVVVFGGIERHLYFDYAAIELIQEIEDAHPMSVIQGMFMDDPEFGGTYRAKRVIDLTHILLNNEVKREKCLNGATDLKLLSREEVAHMIDCDNVNLVVAAIISAWTGQTPKGDDEDEPSEQPE